MDGPKRIFREGRRPERSCGTRKDLPRSSGRELLSWSRGTESASLPQSEWLSLGLSGHVGLTGQKKGNQENKYLSRKKKKKKVGQGLTRRKPKGKGWLRKCGPSDGVRTNGEDGGGDGSLGGLWALGVDGNGSDVEQGQRSDAEGRARRYWVGMRRACGCFGSEGQNPYIGSGQCGARQVSGRGGA